MTPLQQGSDFVQGHWTLLFPQTAMPILRVSAYILPLLEGSSGPSFNTTAASSLLLHYHVLAVILQHKLPKWSCLIFFRQLWSGTHSVITSTWHLYCPASVPSAQGGACYSTLFPVLRPHRFFRKFERFPGMPP